MYILFLIKQDQATQWILNLMDSQLKKQKTRITSTDLIQCSTNC